MLHQRLPTLLIRLTWNRHFRPEVAAPIATNGTEHFRGARLATKRRLAIEAHPCMHAHRFFTPFRFRPRINCGADVSARLW